MRRFLFASSQNRIEAFACAFATVTAFRGDWFIAVAIMVVAVGISQWGRRRYWY